MHDFWLNKFPHTQTLDILVQRNLRLDLKLTLLSSQKVMHKYDIHTKTWLALKMVLLKSDQFFLIQVNNCYTSNYHQRVYSSTSQHFYNEVIEINNYPSLLNMHTPIKRSKKFMIVKFRHGMAIKSTELHRITH